RHPPSSALFTYTTLFRSEPTRELATQVGASFELYGKHHRLTMALLIGGESFVDQERKLDRGVDVLIATPGRLLDLYGRGKILLRSEEHTSELQSLTNLVC